MACRTIKQFLIVFLLLAFPLVQALSAPTNQKKVASGRPAGIVRSSTLRTTKSRKATKLNVVALSPSGGGGGYEGDTPEKEEGKLAREAIGRMKFCSKAAFFGVAVDASMALRETGFLKDYRLSFLEVFKLLKSLNLLGIAVGIRHVLGIYEKPLRGVKLTNSDVFEICKTMAGVWRRSAWIVVMGTVLLANSMAEITGKAELALRGPGVVVALAFVGSVSMRLLAAQRARMLTKDRPKTDEETSNVRKMGFAAGRNIALFAGAFALLGSTQLITTLVKPISVKDKAFGMLDVLESAIVTSLLSTLYLAFSKAVVNVTDKKVEGQKGLYLDLFEAQKGVYKKLGITFVFTGIGQLVPSLISAGKFAVACVTEGT